jgi:hypothetical protein
MHTSIVSRICLIIVLFACGLLGGSVGAETFNLTTGQTLTGELLVASANDGGVQIKVEEGRYEKVPWTSFSQDDLRRFKENKKLEPFVEPFIEISREEKIQKTAPPPIKQPPRLERPPPQSLLGALLSNGLGIVLVLLLYAANIYAAYEVSIFRARPTLLVCGLAAIPLIGVLSPILFLSLPTQMKAGEETGSVTAAEVASGEAAPGAVTAGQAAEEAVNPMQGAGVEHPAGLKLHTEAAPAKAALPPSTTYQRGQFTFNRRFFETKFVNFFGVVRRDADKDMVLVIKSARGQYIGQRISRIAANDLHLQVQHGHASEEVMIPFQEIQEIRVQHKDA